MGEATNSRSFLSLFAALLLGASVLVATPAMAETPDQAAPKCEVAEINPVTGHLMCIRPLGAAVEPPPDDLAPPCKPEESRGQWTWAPNCRPAQ
jgi:hypothetical protein